MVCIALSWPALDFSECRSVVVANRTPVSGEKLEQAIGGGMAVERCDCRSERLRVVHDLGFGDFALSCIVCMRRKCEAANPEDMLNPQIAQRHFRFKNRDRVRCRRRCCGCDRTREYAGQDQKWSGQDQGRFVMKHGDVYS
jgi:hypothetical protein